MIYGIVAQDEDAAIEAAAPLASLDFINGVYSVALTSLTASQVVSDTARISADGLSIKTAPDTETGAAHVPSGDLLTLLLTKSYTCIIEASILAGALATGTYCQLLFVANSGDAAYLGFQTHAGPFGADASLIEGDGGSTFINIGTDDLISAAGIVRLGYTRISGHRAVTFGGIAVATPDGVDNTNISSWVYPEVKADLAVAYDGTSGNVLGHIRAITLLDAKTDLELAVLTA